MDKKYDDLLILLNSRYQEIKNSKYERQLEKKKEYLDYLRNREYLKFFLKVYRGTIKKLHHSTDGNTKKENTIQYANINNKKIAVYTCIIGRYDDIIEPLYCDEEIDYILFTDIELAQNSKWKKIDVTKYAEYYTMTPTQLNRKIKMFPCEYLSGYDYSIYIDGSVEVVASMLPIIQSFSDLGLGVHYHNGRDCVYDEAEVVIREKKADLSLVKKQIADYKSQNYPVHNGLYENTILIRNHNDKKTADLMKRWWDEYNKYLTRDQLSLPFVIWKSKYPLEKIFIMGNNIDLNPRFNRKKIHLKKS